jgi:hypothetical protein
MLIYVYLNTYIHKNIQFTCIHFQQIQQTSIQEIMWLLFFNLQYSNINNNKSNNNNNNNNNN